MKSIHAIMMSLLRPIAGIAVICAAAIVGLQPGAGQAQSLGRGGMVPFSQFVSGLSTAQAGTFAGRGVRSTSDFNQMRQHLLSLYGGVTVSHSYVLSDQTFDCIPIMQQPGVRLGNNKTIASPPPGSPSGAVGTPMVSAAGRDAFGNFQSCASGTIPMRRITLEELTRYRTLQDYFKKTAGPGVTGGTVFPATAGPCSKTKVSDGFYHCYAYAYQNVNNYGGLANHNLWVPYVNTSTGQRMSLSQQWYTGGTGTGLQTAEIGWQNQPLSWGGQKAALFIYWTANGYNGTGCYNLSCGAFVQTNSSVSLGAGFSTVSVQGGNQYQATLGYYLFQGNWWAWFGSNWIGYYPGSIFRGGQLSKYATVFEIGGEVGTVSTSSYPPMGSGQWASAGFGHAAFENGILYRDSANGGHAPSLAISQSNTACYTATAPAKSTTAGWGTYFYFGGPGGNNC